MKLKKSIHRSCSSGSNQQISCKENGMKNPCGSQYPGKLCKGKNRKNLASLKLNTRGLFIAKKLFWVQTKLWSGALRRIFACLSMLIELL